ncbi:hypothetical protein IV417_11970 [Alphaproteobacteria bacterium KMM 3653]|uniref:Uncharacterized protein n=1 Tax=Harenicola maris TaxID=2841044 RepID=A0AAP2G4A8_9RHOB|nr:hypothetical protein [Harenicola maris]
MKQRHILGLAAVTLLTLGACADPNAAQGKIPFPSGYVAELPGDRALWETMSVEQQQRALAFLSTGSTIQSSLYGD